jgi:hypothetical protein
MLKEKLPSAVYAKVVLLMEHLPVLRRRNNNSRQADASAPSY